MEPKSELYSAHDYQTMLSVSLLDTRKLELICNQVCCEMTSVTEEAAWAVRLSFVTFNAL